MKRRHGVVLAGLMLAGLLVGAPGSQAEEDEDPDIIKVNTWPQQKFTSGVYESLEEGGAMACSASVKPWVEEQGKSGITRMRMHFELYEPYAPLWIPSSRSSNQVVYPKKGKTFPDDGRNFFITASLPWGMWREEHGERVVVDFVGERPSFWKPDVHREIELGSYHCDYGQMLDCANAQVGELACAQIVEGGEVTGGGTVFGHGDNDQDGVLDHEEPQPAFAPGES